MQRHMVEKSTPHWHTANGAKRLTMLTRPLRRMKIGRAMDSGGANRMRIRPENSDAGQPRQCPPCAREPVSDRIHVIHRWHTNLEPCMCKRIDTNPIRASMALSEATDRRQPAKTANAITLCRIHAQHDLKTTSSHEQHVDDM